MKKVLSVFLCLLMVTGVAYGSNIGLESLWNNVFDSTNNTIRATVSGNIDSTAISADTITAYNTLSADSVFNWAGGRTYYAPVGTDINALIASSAIAAGDTIQLAAGTYTITSTITVGKKVHLRGMGKGITTITCATANVNMITGAATTSGGSVISDLTLSASGALTALSYIVTSQDEITIQNVEFIDARTGGGAITARALNLTNNSDISNIINCSFTQTGVVGYGGALTTDQAGQTINIRECIFSSANAATSGGILSVGRSNVNIYNSTLVESAATGNVVQCLDTGTINIYNSTIRGGAVNVAQGSTAVVTLYDTTLVNNTTSGTITYGTNNSTFKGGNIYYASINDDINALIASSKITNGDTIVLASGTYTITSLITIGKAVHLKGQGIGKTTISCATDVGSNNGIIQPTVSNVRISDMSISYTAANTTNGVVIGDFSAGVNLSGLIFENLDITCSGSAAILVVRLSNCDYTMRNVKGTLTSSASGTVSFIRGNAIAGGSANRTIDLYNCHVTVTGTGAGNGTVYSVGGSSPSHNVTLNLYDCTGVGTNPGAGISTAVNSNLVTNGFINVYGGSYNGDGYDAGNTAGTLTLYDTTLVNGTTDGTITTRGISTVSSDPVSTIGGSVGRIKVISQDGSACYIPLYAG